MSRRSILLLAVTVVLLYFSVILFILSPLHRGKRIYYRSNYLNHFSMRQIPSVSWCKELRWRSPPSPDVVALVSFPGSGNTWLRYLLQQVTGIVTGSIYMDYGLRSHGFPAENVTDGSVLVVKTHEAPPTHPTRFKAAILLIRNPRDAILADFNRLHKGHIGTAPKSAFKIKENSPKKSEWSRYVTSQVRAWEVLHVLWLTKFHGALHIITYEELVHDTRGALRKLLAFLNVTITEDDMKCTLENREGIYKRKKKHKDFDPFTDDMYEELSGARSRVLNLVMKHIHRVNQTTSERWSG